MNKSKLKKRKAEPQDDPYFEVACEQLGNVLYEQFADKEPVVLFDIQEQRVYAYPYGPFARVSRRS